MVTGEKSLTQPILEGDFPYQESWEVFVSNQREPYVLDEYEFAILKQEVLKGSKGTVCFEKFGINLTYFVSYYRKSRKLKPEFEPKALPEPEYNPTPEQREATRKKIEEMKIKLGVKFSKKI